MGLFSYNVLKRESLLEMEVRLREHFDALLKDSNIANPMTTSSIGRMNDVPFLIDIDTETYGGGLGERISRHFRLFTSFMNLGRKFLLAHNRFVSIYDMSKRQWS